MARIASAISCGPTKSPCSRSARQNPVTWYVRSYWSGIKEFEAKNRDYLQTQIGNPEGDNKPNKKYYDPRQPIRAAEDSTVERLLQCFRDLNCVDVLGLGSAKDPANVCESLSKTLPAGKVKGGLPVSPR